MSLQGRSNVILEAMASGLPVVASGISGIPQAVEPELTWAAVAACYREGYRAAPGSFAG
jgi:glycosyltransferase involved in cell wall biosynthesis